jgi:hypothetical protein
VNGSNAWQLSNQRAQGIHGSDLSIYIIHSPDLSIGPEISIGEMRLNRSDL